MDEDEMVDVVDEGDHVIGRSRRADAYARRLRHRCVFVEVRDPRGRIFVHRRTPGKLVFPSRHDMFIGGVVGAGETYDEAAIREAQEELGVAPLPQPQPVLSFLYDSPEHTWWSRVYRVVCDRSVSPQPDEITWHDFLTEDELAARVAQWDWVPDSLEAYHLLRGRQIA